MAVFIYGFLSCILLVVVSVQGGSSTTSDVTSIVSDTSSTVSTVNTGPSGAPAIPLATTGAPAIPLATTGAPAIPLATTVNPTIHADKTLNDILVDIGKSGCTISGTCQSYTSSTTDGICIEMETYALCVAASCPGQANITSTAGSAITYYSKCLNKGKKADIFWKQITTDAPVACNVTTTCPQKVNINSYDFSAICQNISDYTKCLKTNCANNIATYTALLDMVANEYTDCDNKDNLAEDYLDDIKNSATGCSLIEKCDVPTLKLPTTKENCKSMQKYIACVIGKCGTSVPSVVTQAKQTFEHCGACAAAQVSALILMFAFVVSYLL